ncbi:dUTP diphosphatase [Hyphomicrobium sp.]|uniref:dUTP diphosphatase n=1 Tax=Hyphomicrobium sp. TaxID=82 RepID=UPI002D77E5F2|nr:dUTP diphosphatase [Hyphomicrobium sp.]HET6388923.1 dUTP diphosphatase [Hyphomicrobium sp.]
MKVKVRRLEHAEGLPLPDYQTAGAAGFDLVAAVADDTPIIIPPGAHALIPTGLIFELPRGTEAQVRPRSGLAVKHGVTVLNSPGTIDADYRGEVAVILVNLGSQPFTVARGERIAQMIVAPVTRVKLQESKKLSATKRGAGGFGSTGTGKTPSQPSAAKRKAVASGRRRAKTKSRS